MKFMPPRDLSDEEIKALILNFLLTRGRWGGKYFNRQRMTRYLGVQILKDGRRVDRCLDRLLKEGLVWGSKKGATVSLNPHLSSKVTSMIDTYLKHA